MKIPEAIRQELINEGHNCTQILIYSDRYQRFHIIDSRETEWTIADIALLNQTHLNITLTGFAIHLIYPDADLHALDVAAYYIDVDLTDPASIPELIQRLKPLLPCSAQPSTNTCNKADTSSPPPHPAAQDTTTTSTS